MINANVLVDPILALVTSQISDDVLFSACHFFHRYTLQHSVMLHSPSHTSLLCIFMACKVHEYNVTCAQLVRGHADEPYLAKFLIVHELQLLLALDFQLVVRSPFRALRGLLVDLAVFLAGKQHQLGDVSSLYEAVSVLLRKWMLWDIILHIPASQLALAALHDVCSGQGVDLGAFLESLTAKNVARSRLETVRHVTASDLRHQLDRIIVLAASRSLPSPAHLQVDVAHLCLSFGHFLSFSGA